MSQPEVTSVGSDWGKSFVAIIVALAVVHFAKAVDRSFRSNVAPDEVIAPTATGDGEIAASPVSIDESAIMNKPFNGRSESACQKSIQKVEQLADQSDYAQLTVALAYIMMATGEIPVPPDTVSYIQNHSLRRFHSTWWATVNGLTPREIVRWGCDIEKIIISIPENPNDAAEETASYGHPIQIPMEPVLQRLVAAKARSATTPTQATDYKK